MEPKTVRETNLVMEGLEGRLGIIQTMVWAVIGLLGTLIAGAFALYSQVGDIKLELAVIKTNTGVISDRQGKIEESVRSIESKALGSLNRIEARLAANVPEIKPNIVEITPGPTKTVGLAPDNLAPEEIDLIRQYL